MPCKQVNFSLVRYSPAEGTHYFHDPAYPTAIVFLLNGRWEPWDVGWVRQHTHDAEIRRIAEDAEERLIHDPAYYYRQWPPSPLPSARPNANSHVPPSQTFSPSSQESERRSYPQRTLGSPNQSSPSAQNTYVSSHPSHALFYSSPYGPQPPSATSIPETGPTNQAQYAVPAIGDGNHQSAHKSLNPDIHNSSTSPIELARNRETKILLSLDGDGVRGLSAVLLVESLINAICSKIGRRVDPYQIFDLMGGSSTGALLVTMLGRLRMRPHEAREEYVKLSQTMFRGKAEFFLSVQSHSPASSHLDEQAHEDNIKDVVSRHAESADDLFFDPRTDSTNVFVVSTQIEVGTKRAALIRSYPTRRMAGPDVDENLTIWQAMKATSTAPRYVELSAGLSRGSVIQEGLFDYGTSKNNPVRDVFYECRKLYSYANDQMVIVSVGTGSGLDRTRENDEMVHSIDERVAEAKALGAKFEQDNQMLMEMGWMKYFRFNVPGLEDVALDEYNQTEKVMEKTSAYLALPEIGQKFYDCVEVISNLLTGAQQ